MLRSIEVQHGVLVARAEGIYSFSHLTLQEYLTAQYIDDHRQVASLVSAHLTEERWREVFLLVAGLMRGGADDLLLQMERQAQTLLNTPNLKALVQWADQATAGSVGDFKPAAKRSAALDLALSLDDDLARDLARGLDIDIDDRTIPFMHISLDALAHNLALDLNLVLDLNLALDLKFGKIKIFKLIDLPL